MPFRSRARRVRRTTLGLRRCCLIVHQSQRADAGHAGRSRRSNRFSRAARLDETGQRPLRHLLTAAAGRDLRTAGDMAAVLSWRLTALTASANTKNRNNARGVRASPIAHPLITLRRSGHKFHATRRRQNIRSHGALPGLALSDQGPRLRPAGACLRFAAGRAAVWVSAPRGSGGRRLLN
jgi:hypothetical protein